MRNSFRNSVISSNGKQEPIIKIKPARNEQEETTGNMQGESGNQSSNNQEKEQEYPEIEVEVEVEVQEMDDEESPKNEFGALEDEFQGFGNGNNDYVQNDYVQNDEENLYVNPNSRPGSFVDPSLANEIDADQEYRSNGEELEEYVDDVNIEVAYDQSPTVETPLEASPINPLAHLQPIKNEPDYMKEVNLRRDPEEEYFMLAQSKKSREYSSFLSAK